MIHKYSFRKVSVIVLACLIIVSCVYSMRKYLGFSNLTNLTNSLKSKPLPQLKNGPEYTRRRPYHNPQFKNIVFYEASSNVREAALTFDDGPDTIFTPQILDILKKNNIKATFFIVGSRAQANPEIIKRIANEGHAIGNHSWDHPDLDRLTPDKIKLEIQKTDEILYGILGYHPAIVRPPYGAADKKVVQEIGSMGYKIIDWSVDTRDWAGTPPNTIMYMVKQEIRPGGIILQHCAGGRRGNLSNTIIALPEIIGYLESASYKFVKIPDLLDISPNL